MPTEPVCEANSTLRRVITLPFGESLFARLQNPLVFLFLLFKYTPARGAHPLRPSHVRRHIMPPLAILLLAAGSSSRMAPRDKLLEQVNGEPLLALLTRRATLTGLPCFITLPHLSHPRAKWIGEATAVQVPDASEGMAAPIRAGVSALPDQIEAVMILPTDMPEIDCQDLMHIAAHYQNSDGPILRASTANGTPGHPVLFPRRYFDALLALKGDNGARSILVNEPVQLIALPGERATTDLDPPEAWVNWRAVNR